MGSTVLAAFDDGLKNKMDPGEPESRNIYEAMKQGKAVKKLPLTFGDAFGAVVGRQCGQGRFAG